jgi:VWFA-related protein
MAHLRIVGAFVVVFALSAWSQQPAPSPQTEQPQAPAAAPPVTLTPRSHEEREVRYQTQHHIILNLFVTDASGKPVTGLKQEDFTLLDNGQPRTFASFRTVEGSAGIAPVRVVLMLDTVNNSPKDITSDVKGIEQFLKQSQARLTYPTSIALLSGSGAKVGQPSQDRDALISQLRTLTKDVHQFDCTDTRGGSQQVFTTINLGTGSTVLDGVHPDEKSGCLNQRFQRSVSALTKFATEQEDVLGRVLLIWIGRGWPLLLEREFRDDSTALRQNFFDNLVLISTTLREAQVTLDAVFSPDLYRRIQLRSDHDNTFFNGVPTEDQVTASSLGLQVLAHQSGGQILLDSKDLASEIGKCVADAESYYVLSFDTPPAGRPGEFHSIQVNADQPGLKVRTNTAYYTQP